MRLSAACACLLACLPDCPSTCRLAVMHVCTGWQAAIQAAPEVWPTVVLTAPDLEVTLPIIAHFCDAEYWMQQLQERDGNNAAELLSKAAQLSPLAWRVRLEGFKNQVRPVCRESAAWTRADVLWCSSLPAPLVFQNALAAQLSMFCSPPWWLAC